MFKSMHLFAGAGGGLLADLILGHTPIIAVEWDQYACRVLRQRITDGWFPDLSVYEGDVRMFDPSPYQGRVDCIHAGFPCQDISVAGGGKGINGERSGLYREVIRCIGVVRPQFVFLENSPAIVGRGLGTVLGDLAACGYDARWTVLAASDVGAPHQRERWWCLGWRTDTSGIDGRTGRARGDIALGQGRDATWSAMANPHQIPARTGSRDGGRSQCPKPRDHAMWSGSPLGNHPGIGLEEPQPSEAGDQQSAVAGTGRSNGWWAAEPDVGRMAHGVAHRMDRLAAIGNGQVPLCAAAAWKILGGPMNIDHGMSFCGSAPEPPNTLLDGHPPEQK